MAEHYGCGAFLSSLDEKDGYMRPVHLLRLHLEKPGPFLPMSVGATVQNLNMRTKSLLKVVPDTYL